MRKIRIRLPLEILNPLLEQFPVFFALVHDNLLGPYINDQGALLADNAKPKLVTGRSKREKIRSWIALLGTALSDKPDRLRGNAMIVQKRCHTAFFKSINGDDIIWKFIRIVWNNIGSSKRMHFNYFVLQPKTE